MERWYPLYIQLGASGVRADAPAPWWTKLADDSGVIDRGGWGGITLAHNVGTREEVDRTVEEARAAGAQISREPAETFYGGYAGVFLDLDGHPWEVSNNPGFALLDDGTVRLPQG